jgi:hypothetical protein
MRAPSKRRPQERRHPDGATDKKYPDSICHTTLAIQQFWKRVLEPGDNSRLTHREFCDETNFVEVYKGVINRYKGDKTVPGNKETIAAMVNDIAVGRHQLPYYRIRALAEFVGIPSGVFLLFTHAVGDQRHAEQDGEDPHGACLRLIEGVLRVGEVAKEFIEADKKRGGTLFMHQYDAKTYLPNVEALKMWADAFKKPEVSSKK